MRSEKYSGGQKNDSIMNKKYAKMLCVPNGEFTLTDLTNWTVGVLTCPLHS